MAKAKKAVKNTKVTKPKVITRPKNPRTIQIACEGASLIDINDLTEFQGGLKSLSDESYSKLRRSILSLGFSFPVFAWKNQNKNFVLDAHQRIITLKRMRDDDGYIIPKLPVVWIEADNKKQAAKKLLAATSQYGKLSYSTLESFMEEFDLNVEDINPVFELPDIDLDKFNKTIEEVKTEVSFNASTDKEKEFFLEIQFSKKSIMDDLYKELSDRGFIVKIIK